MKREIVYLKNWQVKERYNRLSKVLSHKNLDSNLMIHEVILLQNVLAGELQAISDFLMGIKFRLKDNQTNKHKGRKLKN